MNSPSTFSANNTFLLKAVKVMKFNSKQIQEMEKTMNDHFNEGWELIHVIPFADYAPITSMGGNDHFQPVTTAFQVMMGRR